MTCHDNSYIVREVIQAEPSCPNNSMNWCGIVAVVIDVNSACILCWHAIAVSLVYCTGPLIVVYMSEENQIHLLPT